MTWPEKADALGALARQGASDPGVQAWAARLGLASMGPSAAARRIAGALAQRIGYQRELGDMFASASEVMSRRVDDCDGHAVLGAALAQAASLPARIVGVSLPGERWPRHVRAEIGDGVAWHSADSTPDRDISPTVIHSPIAHVSAPPVAGLFSDGLGLLANAIVLPLRPIAAGARWATDKMRELATDPGFWLALATIVGCSVAGGPAAAMVCTHALPVAKYAMAARGVDADAWQDAETVSDLTNEIDRARRRDPQRFAEAEAAATEVISMIAVSPAAQMTADPQITEDVIAHISRNGRPETRAEMARHGVVFARTPAARVQVVLRVMASPSTPVRADAQAAFDAARRLAAGRGSPAVQAAADPQRTAQQRGQAAALASISAGRCGGLTPRARAWLQGQHPETWAAVWCNANAAERRELSARARIAAEGGLRPQVKAWLQRQYPGDWATRWDAASPTRRQTWLAIARGEVVALERSAPDLANALRVSQPGAKDNNNAPKPPSAAGPIGLAVLLGLGLRFVRK